MTARPHTRPAWRKPPPPAITTFCLWEDAEPRAASCRHCRCRLVVGLVPTPPAPFPAARCTPVRNIRCLASLADLLLGGD